MNVAELNPLPIQRTLFKLSSFKMVPKTSGCYILSTFDGVILYIGLSINLNKRFQEHLDNPEKVNATLKGKAFWFNFYAYDKGNLNRLERTWINQYRTAHGRLPILNKTDSPLS
jgi:excinuclease UvrABC nuclease subunit